MGVEPPAPPPQTTKPLRLQQRTLRSCFYPVYSTVFAFIGSWRSVGAALTYDDAHLPTSSHAHVIPCTHTYMLAYNVMRAYRHTYTLGCPIVALKKIH